MRAWWLLLCALGTLLAGTGGSLLPPAALRLLGRFHHLLGRNRAELGKEEGRFEAPVDFSKLPPNYRTEEEQQRRVGNATVHRRHEINKVTDNETGATLFFERTVTSIEQGERGLAERWRRCFSDDDCRTAQFCSSSLLASQCQECKAKDTPSMAHRDKEVRYYNTNSLPWSLQDGHVVAADLPKGITSEEDTSQAKRLREELVDGYEGGSLPLDMDTDDPDQSNFQELKQLNNQMGQYFGPDFY